MHQHRRRDRRPVPRRRATDGRPVLPPFAAAGADVVLVGYFSAKRRDVAAAMDAAASDLTARGARVVARAVQRRGVSRGGARKMGLPLSPRTLLGSGKLREVARARERTGADAVVFANPLTERQTLFLTEYFDCPVVSPAEIPPPV